MGAQAFVAWLLAVVALARGNYPVTYAGFHFLFTLPPAAFLLLRLRLRTQPPCPTPRSSASSISPSPVAALQVRLYCQIGRVTGREIGRVDVG
eukprot:3791512-Rhodomonas_salina.1